MSRNGQESSFSTGPHSNALAVDFGSVADRHGESSSRAASRSSGNRSERNLRRQSEEQVTPDKQVLRNDALLSSGSLARRRLNNTGGFLLDSMFTNGSPRDAKRKSRDASLQDRRHDRVRERISSDSSPRDSPLSHQNSTRASPAHPAVHRPVSQTPVMDPAQLVQMALNLSESRKRNVSNAVPVPLSTERRDVSGFSRNRLSQMSRDTPNSQRSAQSAEPTADKDTGADNIVYTFTPATLSRAEKARKYFEQANEYRRLLQHLPPLKPEDTLNSEGSKLPILQPILSHTLVDGKQELGRKYNPIQSLRNRRVRVREKKPLLAEEEHWQDIDKIKEWVDNVELEKNSSGLHMSENDVVLPPFPLQQEPQDAQKYELAQGRRRTDTVSSVVTRPENSWTIEPSELLADAYWTERDGNKGLLENRRGNLLFPSRQILSVEQARKSVESRRSKDYDFANSEDGGDSEAIRISRRRKLMMPLKTADPRRHKRLLSRPSSVSSATSFDSPAPRTKRGKQGSLDENIGSFERYMQERIAKEEKDERAEIPSPEAIPPDRWGLMQRSSIDQYRHSGDQRMDQRPSLEVPIDHHRRSHSADGRIHPSRVNSLLSMDESGTNERPPQLEPQPSLAAGLDLSSPDHQNASGRHRTKRSKLGLFRSHSKDRQMIAETDFAATSDGPTLAPIISIGSTRTRSSMDSARLGSFRRHKTGDSVSSVLGRTETNATGSVGFSSTREPASSVGRFLKGGRIGGIVRGENGFFGDRFRHREKLDGGDLTDPEIEVDHEPLSTRVDRRDTDETDGSPRSSSESTGTKPKYHLGNLPAFTSSGRDKRPAMQGSTSTISEFPSFKRISKDGNNGQKPPDRQIGPRIILSDQQLNASDPELARNPTNAYDQGGRKNYGRLNPQTASSMLSPLVRPALSPNQRHWSISDQATPVPRSARITKRDITRVQALLLSSGIKAHEIKRRAALPRMPPSQVILRAAETAKQSIGEVPREDDHLIAAQLLCDVLEQRQTALKTSLEHFQTDTMRTLTSRLDSLHARAGDHLTTRVHDASDSADAFVVELTTLQPQQVKQVDDAVDAMLRQRRRQFRLLRRAGFKLLEYFTLSLMWGIWLVVVLLNSVRKMVFGIFIILRWLLTF